MAKLERPMIFWFWESVGGTLITEFQVVPRMAGAGRRLLDAVILPRLPKTEAHWRNVRIDGEDVIVVQAKAHRLGMYLMGQALFSAELLRRRFKPKSIRSVILCSMDDSVLRPLLAPYAEVEVVVCPGVPTLPTEEEVGKL